MQPLQHEGPPPQQIGVVPCQPDVDPQKIDGKTVRYVYNITRFLPEMEDLPPKDGVNDPRLLAIPHEFLWRQPVRDPVTNKMHPHFEMCGIRTLKSEDDISWQGLPVETSRYLLTHKAAATEAAAHEAAAHEAATEAATEATKRSRLGFVKKIFDNAFDAAKKYPDNAVLASFKTLYGVFEGRMNPIALLFRVLNNIPQKMVSNTEEILCDLQVVSFAFPERSREYLRNLRARHKSLRSVEERRLKAVINYSIESEVESVQTLNNALKELYGEDLWTVIH